MRPSALTWEGGTKYEIDQVIRRQAAASRKTSAAAEAMSATAAWQGRSVQVIKGKVRGGKDFKGSKVVKDDLLTG